VCCGNGVISRTQAFEWFHSFRECRENLNEGRCDYCTVTDKIVLGGGGVFDVAVGSSDHVASR
jgi:hypothetical protein